MNKKLYVGNLPWTTTEEALSQHFANYGTVVEAKIIYDKETTRSKGFAFVTFDSEESADKAIEATDGQDFGGRQINVKVAENRPKRGGFSGGGDNYHGGDDRGGYGNRGGRGGYGSGY